MSVIIAALVSLFPTMLWADTSAEAVQPTVMLVVGAAGEPAYGSNFVHQVDMWKETAARASAKCVVIGDEPPAESTDREALQEKLQSEPRAGSQALWLVLIGHGTFDGSAARFNLRGPDFSAAELANWLQPFTRPLVVINTASASAPFLSKLSGTNRIIVTATRSGEEHDFTRFGEYLAGAFADPESDLDRDDQVSLLEAFLVASSKVQESYKTQGRLATEHALLDDNGDGKGTSADWFQGIRAIKSPKEDAKVDGSRAGQIHLVLSPAEQALPPEVRARRDALELAISKLRGRKSDLGESEYYRQLETLFLELARLYHSAAGTPKGPAAP